MTVTFSSEKESIRPENAEITKHAFRTFLKEMKWTVAEWCFEDLLREKTGEHEFRADGKTPNWYHEFRECFYDLAQARAGHVLEDNVRKHGGLHAAVGIILRHDSWEDLGKDKIAIYSPLEKRIHALPDDDGKIFELRQIASTVVDGVDLLTRKTPKLDDEGQYLRKPSGKLVKIDRFGGDLNVYITRLLENPNTARAKFIDSIEGMMTRGGFNDNEEPIFSLETNITYTNERRGLFGRRETDLQAIEAFPEMKKAIKSLDSMLGILLVCQETVNDFKANLNNKPENAKPIRIGNYTHAAKRGFRHIPSCFHPVTIFLERLEDVAKTEGDNHTRMLLDKVLYPSLQGHFKMPYNFVEPSGQDLSSNPDCAPK